VIDFHTHFLPEHFPPLPVGISDPAWPRWVRDEATGRAQMMLGERLFRAFDPIYWDVGQRLAGMDADGVDTQVISPLPEMVSYWIDPVAGAILCKGLNDACADQVGAGGGRLLGLGVLPLQDVEASLVEIERVAALPGVIGLFVGSNVNGVSIAAERFDPVMAAAERLGLIIFVHGIRPDGLDRLEGPPLMGAVIGIPHENTQAIASFIMRDVLGRFPALQLVFSHGGGGIGAVLDRMALIWSEFPAMRETLTMSPSDYARRFWYDTAVFGAAYVRYLVERFGADRILAGTDGPTEIGQKDVAGFLASAGLGTSEREAICGGNAQALMAATSNVRRLAA
jgi:aminocarboxymuconate-semialdehyde decarboxylase